MWNLAKEGGWKRYKELTDQYIKKLDLVIDDEQLSTEEIMIKMSKILEKVKFKSFGTITFYNWFFKFLCSMFKLI